MGACVRPCAPEAGSQNDNERRFSMNKAWTEVLVPLLVAATEAILEVIKILKKKGKMVS